ncbi:unnamed protein product [Echinostoma caproni]|uniref:Uncharacterized protein n=1 Tax=Echinostoma caproni TaxID=27848 RepID=A0A183B2T4_9TREM|nr:unnamed protein product [Echinostoma caproni]
MILSRTESTAAGYRIVCNLDFPSETLAEVACRTLSVDPPPKRSSVNQHFSVSGSTLVCECSAPFSHGSSQDPTTQLSKLRIAAHSVVDLACLVLETVETFKPTS